MTAIEKSVFYWCEQLLQYSSQQLQASANITNTNSNMNTNLTAQFSSLLVMANPNIMTTTPAPYARDQRRQHKSIVNIYPHVIKTIFIVNYVDKHFSI